MAVNAEDLGSIVGKEFPNKWTGQRVSLGICLGKTTYIPRSKTGKLKDA